MKKYLLFVFFALFIQKNIFSMNLEQLQNNAWQRIERINLMRDFFTAITRNKPDAALLIVKKLGINHKIQNLSRKDDVLSVGAFEIYSSFKDTLEEDLVSQYTLLQRAILMKNVPAVRFLLTQNPDLTITTDRNLDAFDLAKEVNSDEIVTLLDDYEKKIEEEEKVKQKKEAQIRLENHPIIRAGKRQGTNSLSQYKSDKFFYTLQKISFLGFVFCGMVILTKEYSLVSRLDRFFNSRIKI
jgi:hypothetical protein